MFTKFKKRVSEQSSSSDVPSLINKSNDKKSSSSRKESFQSDDNQSSDDTTSVSSYASKILNDNSNKRELTEYENKPSPNTIIRDLSIRENDESAGTGDTDANGDTSINSKLKQLNNSLLNQIGILTNELNQKLNENEDLRIKFKYFNNQIEEQENENKKLQYELESLKLSLHKYENEVKLLENDKNELIIKNSELSQKYEMLKLVNSKQLPDQQISKNPFTHIDNQSDITAHSSLESSELEQKNKSLQEELNEKDKVIKNLQQRLNDMKRMLQKELKYQSLPNESEQTENSHPNTPINKKKQLSQVHQQSTTTSKDTNSDKVPNSYTIDSTKYSSTLSLSSASAISDSSYRKQIATSTLSNLHDDVNFKYLKHVVLKFLTSREYEALHLVRALAVLLNFTNEEEKALKETLTWKMSWFGSKPKILAK